jgi:hypothetical protein
MEEEGRGAPSSPRIKKDDVVPSRMSRNAKWLAIRSDTMGPRGGGCATVCVVAGTRATARDARVSTRGVPSGPRGGFPSRGSVAARCRERAENPPPTRKPSGRARGASLRGRIGNRRARRIRGAVTRGRTFIADILQELLRRRVERGVLHHVQHLRRRGGERQRRERGWDGCAFSHPRWDNFQERRGNGTSAVRLRASHASTGAKTRERTHPEPLRKSRPRGLDEILRALARMKR